MRKLYFVAAALLFSGCAGSTVPVTRSVASLQRTVPSSFSAGPSSDGDAHKKAQHVYWTVFAPVPQVQIESAKLPLQSSSKVTQTLGTTKNMLDLANAMFVDAKGTLWVLTAPSGNDCGDASIADYPKRSFKKGPGIALLAGSCNPDHLRFDASGNLWVTSANNNEVLEYAGPFPRGGTIQPILTLTDGIQDPSGITFDSAGNLYVSIGASTGTDSIAVFKTPISNSQPYFLNGLTSPGGLIFDSAGDLYTSSNPEASAIVRYNANNLKSGATPDIVDHYGLDLYSYGSDFAFDAAGNLYDADCGSLPGIYTYPTGTQPFSATLTPTYFSDPRIMSNGCTWGIAVY